MEELLKIIYSELSNVHDKVYLEYNMEDNIEYPYVTYSYSSEYLNSNREGFFIDINIFGAGNNTIEIDNLAHKFKRKLHGKTIFTCEHFIQFQFRNSSVIPTENKNIRRRWIEVYVKVDWRD